jgi:hypothetical protein
MVTADTQQVTVPVATQTERSGLAIFSPEAIAEVFRDPVNPYVAM